MTTLWVLRANGRDIELPEGCERPGAMRHAQEWATELEAPVRVFCDDRDGSPLRLMAEVLPWQEIRREKVAARLRRGAEAICPVNRVVFGHRERDEPPCESCTRTAEQVLAAAGEVVR